jgi:hypothetical protein
VFYRTLYILDTNTEHCIYWKLTQNTVYTGHQHRTLYILDINTEHCIYLTTMTPMSSSHLHLHTITNNHSYVKVPSPSPHNYMRSQSCQAPIWDLHLEQLPMVTAMLSSHIYTSPHNDPRSQLCQGFISISTQLTFIVGNCVEMEMEAWHSFDRG